MTKLKQTDKWENRFADMFNGQYDLGHYHGDISLGITDDTENIIDFIRSLLFEHDKEIVGRLREMGKVPAVESWRSQFKTHAEVLAYNQALDDVIKIWEDKK